jgi:glycosyltransferase involved in cell wall biosynthesis
MECMACGVPTILSANTGHMDLLAHNGVALPLVRQPQPSRDGEDTTDWGESDVEEIVEALERIWRDRKTAAAMGERGARLLASMTWRDQVGHLMRTIGPLLP